MKHSTLTSVRSASPGDVDLAGGGVGARGEIRRHEVAAKESGGSRCSPASSCLTDTTDRRGRRAGTESPRARPVRDGWRLLNHQETSSRVGRKCFTRGSRGTGIDARPTAQDASVVVPPAGSFPWSRIAIRLANWSASSKSRVVRKIVSPLGPGRG